MGNQWRSWRAESRVDWGNDVPPGQHLPNDKTQLGAILRIADALEKVAPAIQSAAAFALREATAPPAKPHPPEADPKAQREAESRARAWAAYIAAGGTMPAEEGDGLPDLRLPVAKLNFSVRPRKAMFRESIETVGDLVQKTADELLCFRNFGMTSLIEVREKLAARGLALAGDPAPVTPAPKE